MNNSVVTDSTIIAQGFNSYFQSVFLMERATIARIPVEDSGDVPTNSVNGVVSVLRKLEDKKSAGPDGLPNAFLKRFAAQVSLFSTRIFKFRYFWVMCQRTGVWPALCQYLKKGTS